MHSLNKISYFLLLISLTSSVPVLAYSSGNDIVITRKAPAKKALLDRKFIFMQEAKAPINTTQSQRSDLTDYSSKSLIPVKVAKINNQKKIIIKHPSTEAIKDNWDSYAEEVDVELQEDLGVEAKLLNVL